MTGLPPTIEKKVKYMYQVSHTSKFKYLIKKLGKIYTDIKGNSSCFLFLSDLDLYFRFKRLA